MTRNKKLVRLMAATVAATTVATSVPAFAAFDASYYAKQNPDVVAVVGTTPKALENHYNTFGKKEGRAASAEELANSPLRQIFDAKLYAQLYPDVVAVFGTDADKLFQHFMAFGINEGRKINQYFDVNAYKAAYPDLAAAFGDNTAAYYQHFATNGIKEHRTLGGFPAENILPGGVKKATASASSGGSSGGSGGGSVSSGGSSSGAVTPGSGLPTNVAHNAKAVAAANEKVAEALGTVGTVTYDSDGKATVNVTGSLTQTKKDQLVKSAQSTLQAAEAVNTAAQAKLDKANAENEAAKKALKAAEDAVKDSKNDKVKTFAAATNAKVQAVATAQADYYDKIEALENAKKDEEEAAAKLATAQAAAKEAQANYNTALQNAKNIYTTVSGQDASYIADKKPEDVKTALNNLAKNKAVNKSTPADNDGTTAKTKDAVNSYKDTDDIIGTDGKVNEENKKKAIAKLESDAKADVEKAYQVQYLLDNLKGDKVNADGTISTDGVAYLATFGITATADKTEATTTDIAALVASPTDGTKLPTSAAITTAGTKIGNAGSEKTLTEAKEEAATAAVKALNDAIEGYDVAVSRDKFVTAENAKKDADATLNGGTKTGGSVVTGAVKDLSDAKDVTTAAETAVTNAEKAVTTAEEARDKAYADEGVAGNAELAARDAAQATAAKEAYEQKQAAEEKAEAQLAEDNAYKYYNAATDIPVVNPTN